ncbi:hypothetical protein [Rhodocista pekingensis]|uniref:Uncharacterized protein n=1 Tax=Rhodocista pekingensis TaxID=201185 RepID=A0ABW2KYJ2_9PROT
MNGNTKCSDFLVSLHGDLPMRGVAVTLGDMPVGVDVTEAMAEAAQGTAFALERVCGDGYGRMVAYFRLATLENDGDEPVMALLQSVSGHCRWLSMEKMTSRVLPEVWAA